MKNFAIGLGAFIALVVGWMMLSNAVTTPEQKAISECISELNAAANGGLSRSQLESQCQQMCVRGDLDGCG